MKSNLDNLVEDLKTSNLAVFVGAGVTCEVTGVTWKELVSNLLKSAVNAFFAGERDKGDPDELISWLDRKKKDCSFTQYEQATLIRRFWGDQYLYRLQAEIYKKQRSFSKEELPKYPMLQRVAELCLRRASVVINYNYDFFLDQAMKALEQDGPQTEIIFGPVDLRKKVSVKKRMLPVYHVHGRLVPSEIPPNGVEAAIVLCQEDYFKMMLEPFCWQTVTQVQCLRDYTCLFVGTSLTDLNMLRMLQHAYAYKATHSAYVVFSADNLVKDRKLKKMKQRVYSTLLDDMGVRIILSDGGLSQLPQKIEELNNRLDKEVLSNDQK